MTCPSQQHGQIGDVGISVKPQNKGQGRVMFKSYLAYRSHIFHTGSDNLQRKPSTLSAVLCCQDNIPTNQKPGACRNSCCHSVGEGVVACVLWGKQSILQCAIYTYIIHFITTNWPNSLQNSSMINNEVFIDVHGDFSFITNHLQSKWNLQEKPHQHHCTVVGPWCYFS